MARTEETAVPTAGPKADHLDAAVAGRFRPADCKRVAYAILGSAVPFDSTSDAMCVSLVSVASEIMAVARGCKPKVNPEDWATALAIGVDYSMVDIGRARAAIARIGLESGTFAYPVHLAMISAIKANNETVKEASKEAGARMIG